MHQKDSGSFFYERLLGFLVAMCVMAFAYGALLFFWVLRLITPVVMWWRNDR